MKPWPTLSRRQVGANSNYLSSHVTVTVASQLETADTLTPLGAAARVGKGAGARGAAAEKERSRRGRGAEQKYAFTGSLRTLHRQGSNPSHTAFLLLHDRIQLLMKKLFGKLAFPTNL